MNRQTNHKSNQSVKLFVMRDSARKVWLSRWTPAVALLLAMAGWMLYRRDVPRATFQLDGDMLVSGNQNLHEVCLTFDDGPHSGSMDKILDTLKEEKVRATFFVVGKIVDQNPDLVRRMMAEGHEVGNHTYTHKRLNKMPLASARQEIAACAASVKRATGADMMLLRPPGMEFNNEVLHLSQDMGYVTVHWNVVAADYVPVAPEVILNRVLTQTKAGSVILLHDSPDTAVALRSIIRELKAKKYRFVTTTQMLSRLPRPVNVASNAYSVLPVQSAVRTIVKTGATRKTVAAKPLIVRPMTHSADAKRTGMDLPTWDGGTGSNIKENDWIDDQYDQAG